MEGEGKGGKYLVIEGEQKRRRKIRVGKVAKYLEKEIFVEDVVRILSLHILRKHIAGFVESFRNPNKIYLCEKRIAGWFCRDASIFEKIDLCRVDLRLRNLPEIFSENEINFLPKGAEKK